MRRNKMVQLISKITIIPRKLITDKRGWFLKAIDGLEEGLPSHTGEVYFTCAKPGQAKGSHYHEKAKEWFTLITGEATLWLQDVKTNEKLFIELDSDNPITVFVPPFVAHTIDNLSDSDAILCAYTDSLYDPADTISFIIEK
jgi:dTDP-4-dehydrorhamnose 3,5-epimerase-like enzyme